MSLATDIITTIRSSDNGKSMELKALRNSVLKDNVDKQSKKLFKSTIKELEKDDKICLSSDGIVKLSKSQRSTSGDKKSKKEKKKKKRKRESKGDDDDVDEDVEVKKKKQGSVDEDDIEDTKEEDQNDISQLYQILSIIIYYHVTRHRYHHNHSFIRQWQIHGTESITQFSVKR